MRYGHLRQRAGGCLFAAVSHARDREEWNEEYADGCLGDTHSRSWLRIVSVLIERLGLWQMKLAASWQMRMATCRDLGINILISLLPMLSVKGRTYLRKIIVMPGKL